MTEKTRQELIKTNIQTLIDEQMKIKVNNTQLLQALFRKLENIRELEQIEQMPPHILNAYITYKQAWYSNYQAEHLKINQFDKEGYLDKLEKEVKMIKDSNLKEFMNELDSKLESGEIDIDKLILSLKALQKIKENDRK